jgi:AraC family transcriptional regulator of adaptative response / DNA-3-methyladenine glycosylase II
MRLITDGIVEREGVPGLAKRLGYSDRHVTRVLTAELGAGPLALARAHRAHSARLLIETTTMPLADIAFASGFASVRQFNDTIKGVFATTPTGLRAAAKRHATPTTPGKVTLRLPYREPFDYDGILSFLIARAIPGVEAVVNGAYGRTMRLAHGTGTAWLTSAAGHMDCTLSLTDMRDLSSAVSRMRRLLDLDADPGAVGEVLGADPQLEAQVRKNPGLRLPGAVDGAEIVTRALIGQQISVAAARTALTTLTAALGDQLPTPDGPLTKLFPTPRAIAERGQEILTGPRRRIETIQTVNESLATGALEVHVGADPAELSETLQKFTGVGPWTAGYVLMRVLGAPDVLLTGDVALRKGAKNLGLPATPADLESYANKWRPWRSYAGMHLWSAA